MGEIEFVETSDEDLEKMIDSLYRAMEESEQQAYQYAKDDGRDCISLREEYMLSDIAERLALLERELSSRKDAKNES